MTLLSTKVLAGGIGAVAVDLLHKKEKVAADMLRFYLKYYKEQGACLATLYPFRPDFYKRMGFGYGTSMQSYKVMPASLPQGPSKTHLQPLKEADHEALISYRRAYAARRNGMLQRPDLFWEGLFKAPEWHTMLVKRQGEIRGYIIYRFLKKTEDNFLDNDMHVRELLYDTAADLQDLLTYLHIQKDQINRIIINSQDEHLYFLFADPRNGSSRLLPGTIFHESNAGGVGVMYRVIDVPLLFELLANHNFNDVSCRVKLTLQDTFFPENGGAYIYHFENGRASAASDEVYDVEISLNIAEFSSLITGVINFAKLHTYGLAAISDEGFVPIIDRMFRAPKPICLTSF